MILKQGHTYRAMPHDGKVIRRIYRGGRCYYINTPYSPEATQALRAAFPQYWTAIRDYGVAHPALVPFVNEDPMLIVSLVEVGKTRWIGTTAANQFFITDVKQYSANQLVEKAVVKYDKTSVRRLTGISGQGLEYWGVTAGNAYEKATVSQPDISKRTEITHKYTQTNTVLKLFAISDTGQLSNRGCYRSDTYLYLSDTLVKHYVPFKRNGEMEYLNLLDFTLATRVGTFTEIIEDKE